MRACRSNTTAALLLQQCVLERWNNLPILVMSQNLSKYWKPHLVMEISYQTGICTILVLLNLCDKKINLIRRSHLPAPSSYHPHHPSNHGLLAGSGRLVTWNTSSNRVDKHNEKARLRHAEAVEARVLRAKRMQNQARLASGREWDLDVSFF